MKNIALVLVLNFLYYTNSKLVSQTMVKDINPGNYGGMPGYGDMTPYKMCISNGVFYFVGGDSSTGYELWKSDGTQSGTNLVKDIVLGTGLSYINNLTDVNGTLFFTATTNGSSSNPQIWKSDGTAAGTIMVKDLNPTGYSNISNLTAFNGNLYFAGKNSTNGLELWKSDGTTANTVMLKDIWAGALSGNPQNLIVYNNFLYFSATDGTYTTLWKTDGSNAGTTVVKTPNGPNMMASSPDALAIINNILYFNAGELWKTDGTNIGTVEIKDIYPGTQSSNPRRFIDMNGTLYFLADNGTNGNELWKSDGTGAGTSMVKDINTGSLNGVLTVGNYGMYRCVIGSKLYFMANDGLSGYEIWETDGTSTGTNILKDIVPGTASSYPEFLINYNGKLIFQANDPVKYMELWESDGTTSGTVVKTDMCYTSWSNCDSRPGRFLIYNNELYFSATTNLYGHELWKFSGTFDVGIKENFNSELGANIYPNPTTDHIIIELNSSTNTLAELFSIDGQLIESIPLVSNKNILQINHLSSGLYLVKLKTKEGVVVKKIIKN